MKKVLVSFVVAVLFLSLTNIGAVLSVDVFAGEEKVATISPNELKQRLDSKNVPILLDVREVKELADDLGHLPGIKHIPIGSLSSRLSELDADKDKEIVTICRMGGRATKAAKILTKAGFKDVKVLEGGMSAYRKAEGQ
ncbi:MAG TPA: rhodanese-like domain-containing protein [Candidatus Brocadiia bacterium]|nr:rhodanese-like domain-containing protein [Candidatus Brocadiales bacterium]